MIPIVFWNRVGFGVREAGVGHVHGGRRGAEINVNPRMTVEAGKLRDQEKTLLDQLATKQRIKDQNDA